MASFCAWHSPVHKLGQSLSRCALVPLHSSVSIRRPAALQLVMEGRASAGSPRRILVVSGPTASGKSDLAMAVAVEMRRRGLQPEIVVADSVQVYEELTIGSNKPSLDEQRAVRHHLVDAWSLRRDKPISAGQYFDAAVAVIHDVLQRGAVPIVVGGTMMYIRWLVFGKPAAPPSDPKVRAEADAMIGSAGGDWDKALKILADRDPVRASQMTRNDWYRLSRSLEIFLETGQSFDTFSHSGAVPRLIKEQPGLARTDVTRDIASQEARGVGYGPFESQCYFISGPRTPLYERIDRRCEQMLENGLLEEVGHLCINSLLMKDSSVGRAIGYRQTIEFLEKLAKLVCTDGNEEERLKAFREYLTDFKTASRNYAGAQAKWFRKEKKFIWIPIAKPADVACHADSIAENYMLSDSEWQSKVDALSEEQDLLRKETYDRAVLRKMKLYREHFGTLVPGSDVEAALVSRAQRLAEEWTRVLDA
ncbi:tRNA dimethylallyltransferase 9 [Porphyridium purpureum]|uniref:tRNA dimethylallyltransferase n=1 Tax=Porphyridium purpureum TaxID=35688 RepID=A0A5J4Z4K8_PORPP|nr:tRNA dimethylallyltransferase 9 [Porphyridium purpureum]|eukprot:POR1216..scf295_1